LKNTLRLIRKVVVELSSAALRLEAFEEIGNNLSVGGGVGRLLYTWEAQDRWELVMLLSQVKTDT
jgi:hypothetical protein